MSFFLIRELGVIYIFLFYAYFYFAIDEEFIVFIVLAFWTIFLIVFYLKTISSVFYDSMESLSSEFFFFHDRKNMVLSIFRDQYYDFILLNKFLYIFFYNFKKVLNISINNKITVLLNTGNVVLSDSLNFFKSYFKMSILFFYTAVFAHFHNTLTLLIREINDCLVIFNLHYNKIKLLNEQENIKKIFSNDFSENSMENLLPFLVNGTNNTYDFNSNIFYSRLKSENIVDSNKTEIFNQLDLLKKPSVLKIVKKLNLKVYFNHLFLYAVLREYSFLSLKN